MTPTGCIFHSIERQHSHSTSESVLFLITLMIMITGTFSCPLSSPTTTLPLPTSISTPFTTDPSAVGAQAGLIAAAVSLITVIVIILFLVSILVYKRRRESLHGVHEPGKPNLAQDNRSDGNYHYLSLIFEPVRVVFTCTFGTNNNYRTFTHTLCTMHLAMSQHCN